MFLSLITFNANDPSLNVVHSGHAEAHNKAGLFGAYTAGLLNDFFGVGAIIWPFIFAFLGGAYISFKLVIHWWRWFGFFLLAICLLTFASSIDLGLGDLSGGGIIGDTLYLTSMHYLSPIGSSLLWLFIALIGTQLSFNISWINLINKLRLKIQNFLHKKGKNFNVNLPDVTLIKKYFINHNVFTKDFIKNVLANFKNRYQDKGQKLPLPEDYSANQSFDDNPDGRQISYYKENSIDSQNYELNNFNGKIEGQDADQNMPAEIIPEKINILPQVSLPAPPEPLHAQLNEKTNSEIYEETLFIDGNVKFVPENYSREYNKVEKSDSQIIDDVNNNGYNFIESKTGPETEFSIENSEDEYKDEAIGEFITEYNNDVNDINLHEGDSQDKKIFTQEQPKFILPSFDLLARRGDAINDSRENREQKGYALMKCFDDFGIKSKLVRITPGPVVTMYEVRPEPGVKVARITNLENDISLALKAVSVRIQAPIPGCDTVGIEIPNEEREIVNFRELAESEYFANYNGALSIILGKDIAGNPYMADLAKMPHLLVAGATGAGKSVCLNSIIVSLLYRMQPTDLKMLLIDPKRTELTVYRDLPHLVHPIVTEMQDAKNALEWATHEMERRNKILERLGARNIFAYNQKLAAMGPNLPEGYEDLEHLPYLVIIIDELADLIITAAREVQTSIFRLVSVARAAGIHMILATQRPSVDIITPVIKANLPSRIAFRVTNRHDSGTILDQAGAEALLGKGDMLYKLSGGRLIRLHGPFLSDEEVHAVASHWKKQQTPNYEVDFARWSPDAGKSASGDNDFSGDPLYSEIKAFVLAQGKASISLIQRQFRIGFGRSGRLIDQLEREGIIGPADGSKPRVVIK